MVKKFQQYRLRKLRAEREVCDNIAWWWRRGVAFCAGVTFVYAAGKSLGWWI